MRNQTATVRIDRQSHSDLKRISIRFSNAIGRHVSMADAVRMGITLVAAAVYKRELRKNGA